MNFLSIQRFSNSLGRRIKPVISKMAGRSPLCPWFSCFSLLDPRVRWARPTMDIKRVSQTEDQVLMSFNKRLFWFPIHTVPNLELWNEYLGVFWDSPSNFHYYFRSCSDLDPGDVVVDCGACEGFFVAKALEMGASKVFAVEPNPLMVQCLEKTFQQEIAQKRVVILPCALGALKGDVFFDFDDQNPFSGKISQRGLLIQQTTLDDLAVDLAFHKVDFIKMDLEGFEAQALLGARQIILKFKPKLSITTYHCATDYHDTFNTIKGFGYTKIASSGIVQRGGSEAFRPYLIHAAR